MGSRLFLILELSLVLGCGGLTSSSSTGTSFEDPPPVIRGPYLQCATPTSMVVRWRSATPSSSRVYYGATSDELAAYVDDSAVTTDHDVTLTGLQPGTTYYYGVGTALGLSAGGDADHFFMTPPVAGTSQPIRIWVVGDSGTADRNAAAVRDAYLAATGYQHTDVWLTLGDNAYNSGTDAQYQRAVFDMYPDLLRRTVVWPTLGNHDGATADSPTESGPYFDMFTLPRDGEAGGLPSGTEAYYSFDYGNVHFICLDSQDTNRAADGAMMVWLQDDLADTLADWIIAYWHQPPYTKGSHDSDDENDSKGQMKDMRETALPILEAAGVDLVLTGHSHSYERSFLLDGHYGTSDTLAPRMILDGGDGREDGQGAYSKAPSGPGTVYMVAGSSGKKRGGSLDHPAMYISVNSLGSIVVEIDGSRLRAQFLDDTGRVTDCFTIVKGGG